MIPACASGAHNNAQRMSPKPRCRAVKIRFIIVCLQVRCEEYTREQSVSRMGESCNRVFAVFAPKKVLWYWVVDTFAHIPSSNQGFRGTKAEWCLSEAVS